MTYEEAYKKAKELAIKEANKKRNGDYVYVLRIGKKYDISHDLYDFMMKIMYGYKVIERVEYQNQENMKKQRGKRREVINDESI